MENKMNYAEFKAIADAAAAAGDVVPQFDFSTVAVPASLG
jgi:hypothetical protein